jgi:hypothetical protein
MWREYADHYRSPSLRFRYGKQVVRTWLCARLMGCPAHVWMRGMTLSLDGDGQYWVGGVVVMRECGGVEK